MTPRHDDSVADLHELFRSSLHLVFLTGAGISAAAGIPTFRGPTGLYGDGEDITAPVDASDLQTRPEEVTAWHNARQRAIPQADPTSAHRALTRAAIDLERIGGSVTVATMNGDDLHERAGTRALHLHGSFLDARCDPCRRIEVRTAIGTPCPVCSEPMRPDVVAFGEEIDANALWAVRRALPDADAFVAVGLSGQTTAPGLLAREAARHGVPTAVLTLDPAPGLGSVFDLVAEGPADVLDELLADVGGRLLGQGLELSADELAERLAEVTA